MRGPAISPISGLLALAEQELIYPKIVVRLEFHYTAINGDATFPADKPIARVSVVHKLGLIGEYEWLQVFERDLRYINDQKKVAVIEDSLVPPLRLPPGAYDLRVKSFAVKTRLGQASIDYYPRVTIRRIESNGSSLKVYDVSYEAPRGGSRTVDDIVTPELPLVHPAPAAKAKTKASKRAKPARRKATKR